MFDPINKQLGKIPTLGVWSEKSSGGALTSDLPTFSFSPQEYITQIGQHLITLPQHIEPFVVDDNPALSLALKNGKLPYIMDQNSSHLADVLLGSLAQGTTQTYCETIIRINQLTSASTKQLITDIDYLFNVLDDLGLKPGDVDPLQVALKLLEAGRDQFSIVSHSKPAHLVSAIRRMRNI
ncbi:COG7 (predicted) [Pycnogonum litorale]